MSTVDQEYLLSNIAHEVRLRAASPERAEAPVTAPESAEQQASAPSAPRENLSDLQERVRATRELAATFAPERYAYMALVSACLIALLAFCGKLVFGDVGSTPQQVTLMTSALGAGGAASFFGGQLLRIRRRLFDFVEEASTLSGSVS